MFVTAARVVAYLRKNGIDVQQFRTDPDLASKVVNGIYRSIPIPLRWMVRKKRIRRVVLAAQARLSPGDPGTTDGAQQT